MPQPEPRAAIPASLDGLLRQLLREVVREEAPAIATAVLAAFRAEVGAVVPAAPSSPYLTVAAAASNVGVSRKTVRGWIRSGRLRAVSPGRLVRIERGELERFVSAAGTEASGKTDVEAVAAQILAKRRR